jgi:hypothetical protein
MVWNGHSVILFPKWLLSNITYGTKWLETRQFGTKTVGTRWKRQFGTKTFRHPFKKTVRHQDISVPLKKSVKSAPHFLSNKRDYLFQNKINEAIINLIKIESSDQIFTACVYIGDCLLSRWSGLKTIRPYENPALIKCGLSWYGLG